MTSTTILLRSLIASAALAMTLAAANAAEHQVSSAAEIAGLTRLQPGDVVVMTDGTQR